MRFPFLLIPLSLTQAVVAAAWSWTHLPHPPAKTTATDARAAPSVSGHVAAAVDDQILLFGGLTGNAGSPVTDRLWSYTSKKHWTPVSPSSTNDGPGRRMYAAAASLGNSLYLMGGWNPGAPGSGGTFLDDVYRLDAKSMEWQRFNVKLPCGPVSRHTACTVGDVIVMHTFRGVYVLTKDGDGKFQGQATTGEGPEGLSMCASSSLSDESMLVYGGSTKTQQLSSDAYVLDTKTWRWTKLKTKDGNNTGPGARASACAAPSGPNRCVIFGGASLGTEGYEGGAGLQAMRDAWLLTVSDNNRKGSWERIEHSSEDGPEARLAATLTPCDGTFVLQGGWDPKGKTFEDTWILRE